MPSNLDQLAYESLIDFVSRYGRGARSRDMARRESKADSYTFLQQLDEAVAAKENEEQMDRAMAYAQERAKQAEENIQLGQTTNQWVKDPEMRDMDAQNLHAYGKRAYAVLDDAEQNFPREEGSLNEPDVEWTYDALRAQGLPADDPIGMQDKYRDIAYARWERAGRPKPSK